MSFTQQIVHNRHAVWAFAIATAIFGAIAYVTLPMQLFPDTSPPVINIVTIYPGAAAEDVAENLSRPIEDALASLDGVVLIKSSSQDNLSVITVEFAYERNVDLAAVDAQNAIARIRDSLPAEIKEPQVLKFSTSDRPIITVGIRAEKLVDARRFAEDIVAPIFQRVPGVAAVDVFGGSIQAVLVQVDMPKARALGVSLDAIVQALKTHNISGPAGSIRSQNARTTLRLESRVNDIGELGKIPIAIGNGNRLHLKDVAHVEVGALDSDSVFAINGQRAIALQILKTEDANTVEVVRAIERSVQDIGIDYPHIEMMIGEESGSFAEQSIGNLLQNIWQALLLASLVIFLFIGRIKASLVAVISMPMSYGLTFALMKLTGTEFNMVTLTAIILAVGMVVDASVVVLENISRRMDDPQMSRTDAVVGGTDEVMLAVLAGAGSTVAVLIPLITLDGLVGQTFGPLAKTLLFAFISSVVVALILVPVLTFYSRGESRVDRIAQVVISPFGMVMTGVQHAYRGGLQRALNSRIITIVIAIGLTVAGLALIKSRGMESLPRMDGGSFFVSLQTPSGSSIEQTASVVSEIEAILSHEKDIVLYQSQIGFEQGMKVSSTVGAQGPTQGFITATLTPRTERHESVWDIQARVRDKISRVPGIQTVIVRELGNTSRATTAAPIVVRLSGQDPLVLDRLGGDILRRLQSIPDIIEPVRSWDIDQKRVRATVDTARATQFGLTPAQIARQMIMGTDGVTVGYFYGRMAQQIPVHLRYTRSQNPSPDDLLDYPFYLPVADGQVGAQKYETVPLRSMVSLEETVGQAFVTREQYLPTLDVSAYIGNRPLSEVLTDVENALSDMVMPVDYSVTVGGEKRDMEEMRSSLLGALLISILSVYLLLVAQLKSWIYPLIILGTVPMSLLGVGAALTIAQKPVSMPVMVGLILLVGIVVNNAIILLDFIRLARAQGRTRREAIVASVEARFRPIMMTSLSTIVGMIPLAGEWALGAERFSPLATAVIGGMVVATFLTLIVIPIIYDLFEDLWLFLANQFKRTRATAVSIMMSVLICASVLTPYSLHAQDRPTRSTPVVLTLEQSVQRAMDYNKLIQARQTEIYVSELADRQAASRRLPRLDIQASYSRLSEVEPRQIILPIPSMEQEQPSFQLGDSITDIWKLRASISQPIFNGFALSHNKRMTEVGVAISEKQKALQEKDLRLMVEESFFRLHTAQRLDDVAQKSVEVLEQHYQQVVRLAQAGRLNELDIARANARLKDAHARQNEVHGQRLLAQMQLASLLGLPEQTSIQLNTQDITDNEAGALQDLQQKAMRSNTELQLARHSIDIKTIQKEIASSRRWPQINLHAGYTVANPNDRHFPPKKEFDASWDISLVMQLTIWDWNNHEHQVRQAELMALASTYDYEESSRKMALAVAQRYTEYKNAIQYLTVAQESATAAQEALHHAQTMFDAGLAINTHVLEAELELTRARAAVVQAKNHIYIAKMQLRYLLN